MITYLEPDILECEVKWALESIATNKAGGGDRIPAVTQLKQEGRGQGTTFKRMAATGRDETG